MLIGFLLVTAHGLFVTPLGLKLFARFEANRFPRRDIGDFASAGVAAHAALAGLDYENAKPAKLYALSALQCVLHGLEQSLDCNFGFNLRNARLICHLIDYVELYHVHLRLTSSFEFLRSRPRKAVIIETISKTVKKLRTETPLRAFCRARPL
jgi:hypothetical protein